MRWIKMLFSPFKPFKVSCYFGKPQIGTPYFIPKKFFSYCVLGWKTKWSDTNFRFEWNPVVSFVLFDYQLAFTFYAPDYHWEAWLYYEYVTDRSKSRRERIEECKRDFPQTYTYIIHGGPAKTVDYYQTILK